MRISDWSSDVCSSDLDRREYFFDLIADAEEVIGVDRIDRVDRVEHQQGRLTPVQRLAADLERQLLVERQRHVPIEVCVEQLQVRADLLERLAIADRKSTRLNSSH